MSTYTTISPETSVLLEEAAIWRLAGLLFECPAAGWADQVVTLACEIKEPLLAAAAEAARREGTTELYHSTFGPGGPAGPREVSYQRGVLPGGVLAEIRDLYDAFAYRPAVDEAPDHIAVEAGFVAYLHFKQAYALARGDDERAGLCAEVARRFIREHVSRIVHPLASSLACSGVTYLAGAAEALRSRVGAPPAQSPLKVLDEESDEDE